MSEIVVFGAGQIADVARAYIDAHGGDRIVAFTVDGSHLAADTFAGRPLVAWEDLERLYPPDRVKLLGPLSFRRLNAFRRERHLEAKSRGYDFASFVHSSCHVHAEHVGENCFILENCTLQPFSRIGDGVMIWSSTHVGHHATIGDHCFLSTHVGISSNVVLGEECFLAGKASIDYGRTVGARSFLGPAAVVLEDLPPESVVLGETSPVSRFSSRRLKRFL